MAQSRWGLGKGLDALFSAAGRSAGEAPGTGPGPEAEVAGDLGMSRGAAPEGGAAGGGVPGGAGARASEGEAAGLLYLPLDRITANPDQARKTFDGEALAELADSIRENGVVNPIIVEEAGEGAYRIVAGERRFRACRLAGLTEVPALLRSYSGEKRMIVSLIENVQRADLNPIEEAQAYRSLMELTGLSQDETAARVGKNRATVANALRLLKLPPDMRERLQTGEITSGHGRALLAVEDPAGRETLFREILAGGISVREAERRAGVLNGKVKPPEGAAGGEALEGSPVDEGSIAGAGAETGKPRKRDPEITAMEEKFMRRLGTKTVIKGDMKGGAIVIDYYSMDDLDRLYGILGGPPDEAPVAGAPAGIGDDASPRE